MAQPTSDEKRADTIRHMKNGKSKEDIAEWLFVCVRTVSRMWGKHEGTGSCAPEPPNSGRKPLVSRETMDDVVSKIKEAPDMTLLELIDEFSLPISQAALSKRLIGLGLRYKKKRSTQATGGARTSQRLEHFNFEMPYIHMTRTTLSRRSP